ncbi:MAG: hypothetical protein ACOYKZ_08280, partial [Chlamydiia bacterium]
MYIPRLPVISQFGHCPPISDDELDREAHGASSVPPNRHEDEVVAWDADAIDGAQASSSLSGSRGSWAERVRFGPVATAMSQSDAEWTASRKRIRQREVTLERQAKLHRVWNDVIALEGLSPTRQTLVKVLCATAIGLCHWPHVGYLVKWQPFQEPGALDRLCQSADSFHQQITAELEDFLSHAMHLDRAKAVLWDWSNQAGPWMYQLAAWSSLEELQEALPMLVGAIDRERLESENGETDTPTLEEGLHLTLCRLLAPKEFTRAVSHLYQSRASAKVRVHPDLGRTLMQLPGPASALGLVGWSSCVLGILLDDLDFSNVQIYRKDGKISLHIGSGREIGCAPQGQYSMPRFSQQNRIAPELRVNTVQNAVTSIFSGDVATNARPERFWRLLEQLRKLEQLQVAMQALADLPYRDQYEILKWPEAQPEVAGLIVQKTLHNAVFEAFGLVALRRLRQLLDDVATDFPEVQWVAGEIRELMLAVMSHPQLVTNLLGWCIQNDMVLEGLQVRQMDWRTLWDLGTEL